MKVIIDSKYSPKQQAFMQATQDMVIDKTMVGYLSMMLGHGKKLDDTTMVLDLNKVDMSSRIKDLLTHGVIMHTYAYVNNMNNTHLVDSDVSRMSNRLSGYAKSTIEALPSGLNIRSEVLFDSHWFASKHSVGFAMRNNLIHANGRQEIDHLSVPAENSVFMFDSDIGRMPRHGYVSRLDFVYPGADTSVIDNKAFWLCKGG